MNSRIVRTLVVSALAVAPAVAHAGPPLVCWPMSIGAATSLPWGGGWHDARLDYDRARLADDTLALLAPQTPVLVRMETLRRAAVYASTDPPAARPLLDALRARAAAGGEERARALAQFDLGYGAEAYRQALFAARYERGTGATSGVQVPEDAYALVHEALAVLRPNPELEYAAALMSISRPAAEPAHALARKHLAIAAAEATEGSDLARTLAAHARLWAVPTRGALAQR